MIDTTKEYTTRDGREVRIYATDGQGSCPIHGAVREFDGWAYASWTPLGAHDIGSKEVSRHDLIEKPKIIKGWINVYIPGYGENEAASTIWNTKEDADSAACEDRIACIQVEFKEGEGL